MGSGRAVQFAAGHRMRHAGGGRQAQGQAARGADREIAEGLRLEEIAVPADRLDRIDGDAELARAGAS